MIKKELQKLTEGVYPFHMPGHKRQKEWLEHLYDADITEIYGADDLHSPEGIIEEAQKRASKLFGTRHTVFVTAGSTCSILSAITALCKNQEKIILGRNCHKSVYNAAALLQADIHYIYPETISSVGCYGEITPEKVCEAMDISGSKTVVITSPTYEGVVSDIEKIAREVHLRDGILIVDSAHGAHLGFNGFFPQTARKLGADIVIESAHKTLPCLTGASLLHICSNRVSYHEMKKQLGIFETSSPSYPILCSIDNFCEKASCTDLFTPYTERLNRFYRNGQNLSALSLFTGGFDFDKSKIVISCQGADITGFKLKDVLRERYKIELEMASTDYAVAMTSLADTDEGFDRLFEALASIDKGLFKTHKPAKPLPLVAEIKKPLSVALNQKKVKTPLTDAIGKISGEFVYAYPPGSPVIAPGEIISAKTVEFLNNLSELGGRICSTEGFYPKFISVLEEKD